MRALLLLAIGCVAGIGIGFLLGRAGQRSDAGAEVRNANQNVVDDAVIALRHRDEERGTAGARRGDRSDRGPESRPSEGPRPETEVRSTTETQKSGPAPVKVAVDVRLPDGSAPSSVTIRYWLNDYDFHDAK